MSDENVVDAEVVDAPSESTALVKLPVKEFVPQNEDERLAYHMVKSRFFKDASDVSKAVVKIALGRTLGIDSFSAMTGLFVSQQGKLCMTANLMAYLVRRSGKYKYLADITDEGTSITFYERNNANGWDAIGVSRFNKADAKAAGLLDGPNKSNYLKYWRNMSFARAMSNGTKWYTPDAFAGNAVYLPDEIPDSGYEIDGATGEVKESTSVSVVSMDKNSEAYKQLTAAMTAAGVGDDWLVASVGTALPDAAGVQRALALLKIRAKLAKGAS